MENNIATILLIILAGLVGVLTAFDENIIASLTIILCLLLILVTSLQAEIIQSQKRTIQNLREVLNEEMKH